jgi:predicted transcriptional regulator
VLKWPFVKVAKTNKRLLYKIRWCFIVSSKKVCELLANALSVVSDYEHWPVNERYNLVKKGVQYIKTNCPKTKIVKMRLETMEQDLSSGPQYWT